MNGYAKPQQNRGLTAIDAVTALLAILLIVQMWLLSATLDNYLAGHTDAVVPAAIASGLICVVCFWLYGFVLKIDRNARD
jgi:protein-S-isoprenylcysteine O-methyltransferase Ste14